MQNARFLYTIVFFLFLLWIVVADFILDHISGVLCWKFLIYTPWCYFSTSSSIGYFHLLRVSFSLFVYHFILMWLTLAANFSANSTIFKNIHRRLWWLKIPLLIILYIITIFIPNPAWFAWMAVALILTVGFIVCQTLLLAEFSIRANNAIMERAAPAALLVASVVLLIIAGLQYLLSAVLYFFCIPVWVLYALGIALVITIMVVSAVVARGSVFVAAVISLFLTFLVIVAISANAEFWGHIINPFLRKVAVDNLSYCPLQFGSLFNNYWLNYIFGSLFNTVFKFVHTIWGGVFLIIAIITACVSTVSFKPLFAQADLKADDLEGYDSGEDDDPESGADISYPYWRFHLVLALAAASIPVAFGTLGSGTFAWYVPVAVLVAVLVSAGLYLWGLLAPVLMQDYEFFGYNYHSH
ncbi:Serine incorporator/TMS membrane protein [Carpediemonas membranifera]|uniref:Serine incorporator/TMS membrane protein n=1 Tax=Carpediemonas membranifera TaxID=201153 RepID=A0A8J6E1X6_9EUKA|nr:Serine incorporator/TMS membrane protein [Carpediemonas membranifera]|eukprot:KAG9396909.1 Serine incorporator/TMS membrane protein [Carpediemonas membranifera]